MDELKADIQALIKKAQKGDTEAFGKIYDCFIDRIYRFVYFRVGNKMDTEDLTEQIFLKLYRNIKEYKNQGIPFEAWIFRIARNQIIDYYRTKKKNVRIEYAYEIEDNKISPEQKTEQNLTMELVLCKIKELPKSYQEIIILKFVEEKENEEIAKILDKPVSHVRVLQSRALKALKKIIDKESALFKNSILSYEKSRLIRDDESIYI